MENARLDSFQLISLVTLFLLGSTIVVGLNFEARQDIWMVLLITMIAGIALLYFYFSLCRLGNDENLINLLHSCFGKTIAKIIGCIYCFYFLYIAGRVLKDFAFFISDILFYHVHPDYISFTFLGVCGYAIFVGIEAIGRISQILLVVSVALILILLLAGFLSPYFEWENLTPVLQIDLKQLISIILPENITFPFGELVVFTMIFPYCNNMKKIKKIGWIPLVVTGLLLILAGEMIIGIIGPEMASMHFFPFVKAIEMIGYFQFVQHLEILAVLLNIFGGFLKITIFAYAGLHGFKNIFSLKNTNQYILLVCVLILLFSYTFSQNIVQHLYVGLDVVPTYLHVPLQLIVPSIMMLFLLVKKYNKWPARKSVD